MARTVLPRLDESLKHATCEWILIIDCDETLLPGSGEALIRLLPKQKGQSGLRPVIHSKKGVFLLSARVFRREGVQYRYPLARTTYLRRRTGRMIEVPQVKLGHDGDIAEIRDQLGKVTRNLRIAKLDFDDHPDDPHALLNYAWSLHEENIGSAEAIRIVEEVRKRFDMRSEHTTYLLLKGYRAQATKKPRKGPPRNSRCRLSHRYFFPSLNGPSTSFSKDE